MITAYAKIWHEGQLADGYRAIYSAARWEVSSASVPLNVVEAIHRLRDQGDAAMRQVVDMYVRPVQEHMLVRPGDAGSVRNTKLQATLSILSGATGALREEAKVMRAGVLPEQWEGAYLICVGQAVHVYSINDVPLRMSSTSCG